VSETFIRALKYYFWRIPEASEARYISKRFSLGLRPQMAL
jgi:hypothetical protein